MLITVQEFRTRTRSELEAIVRELQSHTGRYGDEEAYAWRESLPKLSDFLASPSLQDLHLFFQDQGQLTLEYQLPASGSFADAVLLGSHEKKPSAIVVELKDWVTRADRPGKVEGLIERKGFQELHPSDQVRGYVEYCRYFHSAVQDHNAHVHGCVLFTRDFVVQPYIEQPNDRLTSTYPLFTLSKEDLQTRAPAYFGERLTEPNVDFAAAFASGHYRQQRGFVQQIARQVLSSKSRPFELLDNQRRALALCKATVSEVVNSWKIGSAKRRVVAVVGPPGSGKSAVAARLWAEVSLMNDVPNGDIMFVTTSLSQNTNWADIFDGVGVEGARGIVRKATAFHPVTTHRLGVLRERFGREFLSEVSQWRKNLRELADVGEKARAGAEDQGQLISIIDEAHSLINPEREGGVGQFGFAPTLGPQAYHIIRASTLSIFFLDPKQGFRHRENTTLDDLNTWARDLGADNVDVISLEGVQFRCAGSTEYVAWLDGLLAGTSIERNQVLASAWKFPGPSISSTVLPESLVQPARLAAEPAVGYGSPAQVIALKTSTRRQPFDFRIFDNPLAMEQNLRGIARANETMRLLSTYSRPWTTRGAARAHEFPPSRMDFHEQWTDSEGNKTWSKVWNVVPQGTDDYTQFVQGKAGSQVAIDPLCEVGCPYAVRGFDYDYVGLLWLEDLVWRNGRWTLNLDFVRESGLTELTRRAIKEGGQGNSYDALMQKVAQAYRILLTRALKGLFVWVKDSETRNHISASLGQAK